MYCTVQEMSDKSCVFVLLSSTKIAFLYPFVRNRVAHHAESRFILTRCPRALISEFRILGTRIKRARKESAYRLFVSVKVGPGSSLELVEV